MRRAAHRDKSEKPIVAALRAVGAHVFLLSGKGVPDLLVFFQGRWTPLEVKTPKMERAGKGGRKAELTAAQQVTIAQAPYAVVESVAEALAAVGIR